MHPIKKLCKLILQKYYDHTPDHVFTVAISGIDAAGKGYIAKRLENELAGKGLRIANVNLDPWQNPVPVRFKKQNAAENFYHNVFRWDDVFAQLIIPLRQNGNIQLTSRLIRTHADEYYDFNFRYDGINILVVEGIFLFQPKYLGYYDFKIWIDCSFDTGLQRAIKRNVEKLCVQKLREDYETYYYAAQRFHLQKDNPLEMADYIYDNEKE